jgi:hypothetical protein
MNKALPILVSFQIPRIGILRGLLGIWKGSFCQGILYIYRMKRYTILIKKY